MLLSRVFRRCGSTAAAVAKTPFYELHKAANGKLVSFSNFLLPVQYDDMTIPQSHLWTRRNASVFDVSHMLQTKISGPKATEALESVTTANLKDLPNGQCKLTMFVDQETGGILDDLIITRTGPTDFYVVTNAGCRDQDSAIFLALQRQFGINVEFLNKNGLLAIQGPKGVQVLQKTFPEINFSELFFMNSLTVNKFAGQSAPGIRVTRCGYTGEDGFEVSLPEEICESFLKEIMSKNQELKFAGLGARDTLRLEAGLCLYGSDMDKTTTPREAVLSWLVDKRRVQEKTLPAAILEPQGPLPRKRLGFLIESSAEGNTKAQPIPRAGMDIVRIENGEKIGNVTSGALSPTLTEEKNKQISVGMAYINFTKPDVAKEFKFGTEIGIKIRNSIVKATISKMPFVKSNYYVKK